MARGDRMLGYAVIGMLAAFGMLCALWVLLGVFLPGSSKTVTYCLCSKEDAIYIRRRWRWLKDLGLIRGRIVILCDKQRTLEHIKQELEHIDPGTTDPTGHHRRGGVPEL